MDGSPRGVLTIDLAAIASNWRLLAARAPASEMAAVVKADAYGLGMAEVAQRLWQSGCRTFFVAQCEEGVVLRAILKAGRIFVLEGAHAATAKDLMAHDLLPVLNTPGEVALWSAQGRRSGRRLAAALQLDSGMTRLGLSAREVETTDLEAIELALVMSHLACADEPQNPMNEGQRQAFDSLRQHLPSAPASFANSGGVLLGPAYHHDLCRPGIALWGGNPMPAHEHPMHPVVTVEAPVLQVHHLDRHAAVGYGAKWRVAPGARIATLGVGYADGLLRAAADAPAKALIDGREVPFAGRISMDLTSLDVSALPESTVHPGRMVTLIGGVGGIDRLATAAGTIPYEVLVRLGRRLERRYVGAMQSAPAT